MQSTIVDKKIQVLYDNYKEKDFANNAQKEIESYRNRATNWGAGITLGAFVANEFVRVSMRSRKYTSSSLTHYSPV